MSSTMNTRAKNLILGALVADAAAMGTHWIYDQSQIRKIAPTNPEFKPPEASDYQGVPGYFAHPNRQSGDCSQYGYQGMVMLRSLHATEGQFDVNHYAQTFRSFFGYGGEYVGYIDHATRSTLDNFTRTEADALAKAKALPFEGDASITNKLVVKALALASQFSGDELKTQFERAVRITHDDDAIIAHGFDVLNEVVSVNPAFGAHDEQFPATSKLPMLIGVCMACETATVSELQPMVEQAIRVTSNHEHAVAYGQVSAAMMIAAFEAQSKDAIIDSSLNAATADIRTALEKALSMSGSSVEAVTAEFGLACDLKFGVPSIAFNVKNSSSYSEAIRNNIYSGGDSCGRSMILGAVMGAIYGIGGEHGIPQDWIDRLALHSETAQLINDLVK